MSYEFVAAGSGVLRNQNRSRLNQPNQNDSGLTVPHQYGFTVPKRRGEPQRPESAARERHRTASICIAEPKPQTLKLVGCHVLRNQNRGRSISRTTTAPKRKYHVLRNQNRSRFNLPTQNGSGFILPNQNGIESEVPRLAEPKPQPLNQPTQNGSGSNLPNQNGIETEAASHLPTQNGGSGFTLADPKRLCLHICRTKTAATPTRRTKTAVAFDSDLPTQNGAWSIAEPKRHQHGSGFTLADPKRLKRLHTS